MSELNICKTCNEHYGGLIYDLPKKEKYEDAKGPVRCRKLKRTDNTMANRGMTKDKQGSGNTNSTNNMV
jgi:hypothetical protein